LPEAREIAPEIGEVHAGIRRYYTQKLACYGATPLGVDWSCVPAQHLRFVQLMKLCSGETTFSLNDLGCGYGALLQYMAGRHADVEIDYLGIDLSPAMVRQARRLWRGRERTRFVVGHVSPRIADYGIASGIFNVKEDQPFARWERFVAETLDGMAAAARRGFAVNFKSPLGPLREHDEPVYRCAPQNWIGYCERELGLQISLVEDYGLREYTLLARK
jgi:SAM-dependent methyltransferase